MSFPTPKPQNAFTSRAGTNQQAEAAQTVRTIRHNGMQETTAGTISMRPRFRPMLAAASPFVFLFTKTSPTGGTWRTGKAFIAGVDTTITGSPTTITGVTTTTYYWILHNFAAGTLTWKSGASYTDSSSDTQEVYRMLEITCDDNVITSFICPHPCDIHATAKST